MSEKAARDPVVSANPFSIVPAEGDESPDYWLLRGGTDPFPLHLAELHSLMDVIDALHDDAHPH